MFVVCLPVCLSVYLLACLPMYFARVLAIAGVWSFGFGVGVRGLQVLLLMHPAREVTGKY